VRSLLDETLTANREKTGARRQVSDCARFQWSRIARARAMPTKSSKVFWNLCDNALRAMPEGGTLTVKLDRHPFWLRIAFRDTGIGLDRSNEPRF